MAATIPAMSRHTLRDCHGRDNCQIVSSLIYGNRDATMTVSVIRSATVCAKTNHSQGWGEGERDSRGRLRHAEARG
jgi:hypothetical protein